MNFNTDNLDYNGLYESDNSIFYQKNPIITLSFVTKHPFITLSFSKVNIK